MQWVPTGYMVVQLGEESDLTSQRICVPSFPRRYRIARSGREQTVRIQDAEQLWMLRAELEVAHRFALVAGESAESSLRRRIEWLRQHRPGVKQHHLRRITEMLGILQDARSPVNVRTRLRIDSEFPGLQAEVDMDSIEKDSRKFQEEIDKVQSTDEQDVDALLASLEELQSDEADNGADQASEASTDTPEIDASDALAGEVQGNAEPASQSENDDLNQLLQEVADLENSADVSDEPAEADGGESNDIAEPAEEPTGNEPELTDDGEIDAALGDLDDQLSQLPTSTEQESLDPDSSAELDEEIKAAEAQTDVDADAQEAAETSNEESAVDADRAAQDVADTLTQAEDELGAIAEAFEQAADDLNDLHDDVEFETSPAEPPDETPGNAVNDETESGMASRFDNDTEGLAEFEQEVDATPDISDADNQATAQTPADTPAIKTVPVTPASTGTGQSPVARRTTDASGRTTQAMRGQVDQIKQNILVELDQVVSLLDHIDESYQSSQEAMTRAVRFEQAAAQTQAAAEAFAEACTQAGEAKAAYDRAQSQLEQATQRFQQAQEQAREAASQASEAGLDQPELQPAR